MQNTSDINIYILGLFPDNIRHESSVALKLYWINGCYYGTLVLEKVSGQQHFPETTTASSVG
jgi:hypothetical protein